MKKLFALILAIALMASMSVTAFADTTIKPDTTDKEGSMEVNFNVDPTYTVTIPATVELQQKDVDGTITYENDYTVSAEAGVRLLKNDTIVITVTSDYEMTTEQGAKLPYTITQGNNTITAENNVVATFTTNTEKQSSTIHIAANDPQFAGKYTDTVTFTIAVETVPATTISFTLAAPWASGEGTAVAGMTWAEYVESEYNDFPVGISGKDVFVGEGCIIYLLDEPVLPTDVIQAASYEARW